MRWDVVDAAMGIFFGTLFVWVPAAWLYFDAEERGHSSYLWGALALVPFWNVLVLVGYFIVRARRDRPAAFPYSRGRIYLNVAIVTFWGLTAISIAVALFALVDYLRTPTPVPSFETPRDDLLRERVAFAIALGLVALPATIAHVLLWRRTRVSQSTTAAGRAVWTGLASALVSVITVISGLIAALAAVGLIFEGVARLLDVASGVDREFSTFAMSVIVPALGSLAVVYAAFWLDPVLQRGRDESRAAASTAYQLPPRLELEPTDRALAPGTPLGRAPAALPPANPPAAPAPTMARFCSQCGSPLTDGARFCSACGTAVGA